MSKNKKGNISLALIEPLQPGQLACLQKMIVINTFDNFLSGFSKMVQIAAMKKVFFYYFSLLLLVLVW